MIAFVIPALANLTALALGAPPAHVVDLPLFLRGETTCPAPLDIEKQLRLILTPVPNVAVTEIAWVDKAETGLLITLLSTDGVKLVDRHLPGTGTCAELAEAAAVVLAAWEIDRHPELASKLPVPKPAPPPVAPAMPPRPVPPAALPPASLAPLWGDIGAGMALAVSRAGAVPGGLLTAGFGWRRFGIGFDLVAQSPFQQAFEGGTISWQRLTLGGGPLITLVRAATISVKLRLDLALGRVRVSGMDYVADESAASWTPAFSPGLRVARKFESLDLWIDIGARNWPAAQNAIVTVDGVESRLALPRWDGHIALGVSWARGRR